MKRLKNPIKGSPVKPRNLLVPVMRLICKAGAHRDKKKEASLKACRSRDVDDGTSGGRTRFDR